MNKQQTKAIMNDEYIKYLVARKQIIYSTFTPTIIFKDGKAELLLIDENTHPVLSKINEMIKERIDQLVRYYAKP